jgi:hypothetical protein
VAHLAGTCAPPLSSPGGSSPPPRDWTAIPSSLPTAIADTAPPATIAPVARSVPINPTIVLFLGVSIRRSDVAGRDDR